MRALASEEPSRGADCAWAEQPRCDQCAEPLKLGYCTTCEQLVCLPEALSPFHRLALPPSPLVPASVVQSAAEEALALWHPLRLHQMYLALSAQQRALFLRDAKSLSMTTGRMSAFKRYHLQITSEPQLPEASTESERALCAQLQEGIETLSNELTTLPHTLTELTDVDAHQERHRVTSRMSRFFTGYSDYLAQLMVTLSAPPASGEASSHPMTDELGRPQPCLTPEISDLIEVQLDYLRRFEVEMHAFERPARPRWSAL